MGANALRDLSRLLVDKWVVEQVEGLQWCRADGTSGRAGGGIGAVKDCQIRMALDALRHQINAAAVAVIHGLERVVLRVFPFVRGGKGMRGRTGQIEVPAHGEKRVTDRFRIEPAAGETG